MRLKRNPATAKMMAALGTQVTLLAGLIAMPAIGQTSSPSSSSAIEEVVITGVRQSLEKAKDIKRESAQVVDAIVAEDIGKLPDSNIAESLQRVSGVQVDRGIGEGSSISIRGLRNNVVLVNGREVYDAGGRGGQGPDTLETSSYGLLSLVPSELVSRLTVTKLTAADDIEGAVGGIVNIVTAKPLDSDGLVASGTISAQHRELAGETKGKGSLLVSNTFLDNTLGLQFSGSYGENAIREDGFNTFSGYTRLSNGLSFEDESAYNAVTDTNGELIDPDPNGDGVLGIYHQDPRFWQIEDHRDRTGYNFIAQWQPSDSMELTYDVLGSRIDSERDRHWLGVFSGFGAHTDVALSEQEVVYKGVVHRPIQTNVEYGNFSNDVVTQALNFDWVMSEAIEMSSELSFNNSESKSHQSFIRFQANNATPTPYDFRPKIPSYSFDSATLNSPQDLHLAILYDSASKEETDQTAFRLDFDHELSSALSLEYGARWSSLETQFSSDQVDLRPVTPADQLGEFTTVWSSPDFLSGQAPDLPRSYLSASEVLKAGGCTVMESFYRNHPDPAQTEAYSKGNNPGLGCDTHSAQINTVEEDFLAFYGKLNFYSELGGVPVSGNIGVRNLSRDLTSTGTLRLEGEPPAPIVTEISDDDLLPSAVIRADLSDSVVLRAGAARVLAYPNTNDLKNDLTIYGSGNGTGGSPELKPFEADQLDVSIEYYFGDEGMLSLGYFAKDIKSFVVQQTTRETIPNFVNPDDGTNQGLISRAINGDGGSIGGIELLYQQSYSMLPSPFDGLGVMATYSYIDSTTPFEDPSGKKLTQPGLSENNINFVAFWEKGPAGVRLAYNWRDEFLDRLGFSGSGIYQDTYEDLSLTASWDFNDRMSVNFEVTNLLDTYQRLYNTIPEATRSIVHYGPSYGVSFRYSL
ncbi:TonB-dependent receptor [Gilvimarinus agarilyticus]|uniref:TonB-dependent receptor n=1 Tax=Gilvimarinus agarilyticus TaxID=679259 RepID=UPI0005A0C5C8|nr:TonB-dependent receptor [Gilvimarinus agarilyticus]